MCRRLCGSQSPLRTSSECVLPPPPPLHKALGSVTSPSTSSQQQQQPQGGGGGRPSTSVGVSVGLFGPRRVAVLKVCWRSTVGGTCPTRSGTLHSSAGCNLPRTLTRSPKNFTHSLNNPYTLNCSEGFYDMVLI